MTTTAENTDPLTTAAEAAWLEYAKGTWSETDRRVFVEGFRHGTMYSNRLQRERETEFMEAAGDGRYCRHHDDDPAHSAICYQQGL